MVFEKRSRTREPHFLDGIIPVCDSCGDDFTAAMKRKNKLFREVRL